MEIILLGIYSFFVWLIFFKFKWLPWNFTSIVITVTLPIVGMMVLFLLLNIAAPATDDVRAMNYVIPIVPRITGQVTEVPIQPNRPIKKGEVLFRIDLEKHLAFLNRPVWLNRHLGHLTGYARNDRDDIVHRAHVVSCGRGNVQKEEHSHHCHDGQRDSNDRRDKVHGQPLEFIENEPDEEPVDAKQDDFHYAFPPLISASSSAARARSCSSSVVADFSPPVCSCE